MILIDDIETAHDGRATVTFSCDDRRGRRWLALTLKPDTPLDEAVQQMRDHWRKEMSPS